jgi:hypothetical protein
MDRVLMMMIESMVMVVMEPTSCAYVIWSTHDIPHFLSLTETRRELGAITYAPNVLGSRGPRKMQVLLFASPPAFSPIQYHRLWFQLLTSPTPSSVGDKVK